MADEIRIQDIGNIALSFGVAIIVVVVMVLIMIGFRDVSPDNVISAGNDSFTFVNDTAQKLTQSNLVGGSEQVWNGTNLLNEGENYSINYTSGTITFLNTTTADGWYNDSVTNGINVSYNYKIGSAARNATVTGLAAQNTFSSFFPLIALAAIGAIIVGIVIAYFRREEA